MDFDSGLQNRCVYFHGGGVCARACVCVERGRNHSLGILPRVTRREDEGLCPRPQGVKTGSLQLRQVLKLKRHPGFLDFSLLNKSAKSGRSLQITKN